MKKVILSAFALSCAASVFAQGTVIFNNRVGGISYVYAPNPTNPAAPRVGAGSADTPSGTTDWSGFTRIGALGTGGQYGAATTLAVLLAAPGADQSVGSLLPATPATSFRTGTGAGNVVQTTATLQGVPADAPVATLQMVVWDNSSGQYGTYALAASAIANGTIAFGKSNPFNVTAIGGTLNPAPGLPGLTSFSLAVIPEPSSFALAGLGTAALLIFRRRKN
jgi:hypothetical protein